LERPWKVQPSYLLTIAQAAEQLGFTQGTLRRYCDRSKIGYITVRWKYGIIGRARRYVPKAAAQGFLQRRAARRLR
jgi:response regulator of citrate/malate metabolism